MLRATAGRPPCAWSLAGGALPPGLALAADGRIAGTPAAPGMFRFTVAAADAAGGRATRALSIKMK